jgi:hypothetical protein
MSTSQSREFRRKQTSEVGCAPFLCFAEGAVFVVCRHHEVLCPIRAQGASLVVMGHNME